MSKLSDLLKSTAKKKSPGRELIEQALDPEREHLSEAMAQCSPKERAFVNALLEEKSAAQAARDAGFGTPESTPDTMASIGYRLMNRDRVIAALSEQSKKALRALAPDAIRAVREIIADKGHKDRARSAFGILERVDPSEQKMRVTHEIKVDPLKATLEYLRHLRQLGTPEEILVKEFGRAGLEYYDGLLEKSEVIEGVFTEVVPNDSGNGE